MLLKGINDKIIFKTNEKYLLQTQDLILGWCYEMKRTPADFIYSKKIGVFPLKSNTPYAFQSAWNDFQIDVLMDWASTNCYLILIEEEEDLKKIDALIRLQINSKYDANRCEEVKKRILENVCESKM